LGPKARKRLQIEKTGWKHFNTAILSRIRYTFKMIGHREGAIKQWGLDGGNNMGYQLRPDFFKTLSNAINFLVTMYQQKLPDGFESDSLEDFNMNLEDQMIQAASESNAGTLDEKWLINFKNEISKYKQEFSQEFFDNFADRFGMDFNDLKDDEEEEPLSLKDRMEASYKQVAQMLKNKPPKRSEEEKRFTAERDRLHNLQKQQKTQKITKTP
jgi:hypothetical protein